MVSFMFVCVMCARSTAGNRTNLQAPVCLLVPAGSPGGSPKAQNGKKTLCFAQTMEMQGTDIGEPLSSSVPPQLGWSIYFLLDSWGFLLHSLRSAMAQEAQKNSDMSSGQAPSLGDGNILKTFFFFSE